MQRFDIRWQNFRGLEDTGWIQVKPITIVLGSNASGKTSLIAPLLILKQTLESVEYSLRLRTQGTLFNAGSFENLVFAHDAERRLAFSLRFDFLPDDPSTEVLPVGAYAPAELHVVFKKDPEGRAELFRFAICDPFGREMVVRTLEPDGRYSLQLSNMPEPGSLFEQAVAATAPWHFLFTDQHYYQARFREQQERTKQQPADARAINVAFEQREQEYTFWLGYVSSQVQTLLQQVHYIGPLRERPRRLYEVSGQTPRSVGRTGESAPEILYRHRTAPLLGAVNRWIQAFDFGFTLDPHALAEGAFNISVRRTAESPWVNLADTGFGLSQVLPLIVEGYYADPNSVIVAEQPEIHLNPRLQSVLADLFADVTKRNLSVLVETHSEHLVLRVRRLVADGTLEAKDVALYYVEREGDRSLVRAIPISSQGHIQPGDWPRGFFDESLREALALSAAQNRAKNAS